MYPFYTDSNLDGAVYSSSLNWDLANNIDLFNNYIISPDIEIPDVTGPH